MDGVPIDNGMFTSCTLTLRPLKPAEYPLAQPYRPKIVTATATTKVKDYVKDLPR